MKDTVLAKLQFSGQVETGNLELFPIFWQEVMWVHWRNSRESEGTDLGKLSLLLVWTGFFIENVVPRGNRVLFSEGFFQSTHYEPWLKLGFTWRPSNYTEKLFQVHFHSSLSETYNLLDLYWHRFCVTPYVPVSSSIRHARNNFNRNINSFLS